MKAIFKSCKALQIKIKTYKLTKIPFLKIYLQIHNLTNKLTKIQPLMDKYK